MTLLCYGVFGIARAGRPLEVIGVVGSERIGDEPTDDSRDVRPTAWSLVGEEDALIRKVFAAPLHDLAERGANRARGLDDDERQQVAELEALSAGPGRPKSRSGAPRSLGLSTWPSAVPGPCRSSD